MPKGFRPASSILCLSFCLPLCLPLTHLVLTKCIQGAPNKASGSGSQQSISANTGHPLETYACAAIQPPKAAPFLTMPTEPFPAEVLAHTHTPPPNLNTHPSPPNLLNPGALTPGHQIRCARVTTRGSPTAAAARLKPGLVLPPLSPWHGSRVPGASVCVCAPACACVQAHRV